MLCYELTILCCQIKYSSLSKNQRWRQSRTGHLLLLLSVVESVFPSVLILLSGVSVCVYYKKKLLLQLHIQFLISAFNPFDKLSSLFVE